jgi:hypothetical protein
MDNILHVLTFKTCLFGWHFNLFRKLGSTFKWLTNQYCKVKMNSVKAATRSSDDLMPSLEIWHKKVNENLASVGLILKQVVETVPVSHLNVDPKFLNKLKCHQTWAVDFYRWNCRMDVQHTPHKTHVLVHSSFKESRFF